MGRSGHNVNGSLADQSASLVTRLITNCYSKKDAPDATALLCQIDPRDMPSVGKSMMHYEATDTRGLAVYNDGVCILTTDDPLHLHSLCLALLLGQSQIAGARIPDLLTLYGIIGAAVSRLKAGETS